MGTTLYRAGSRRTIRGVKCDMKVFEDQAVSDALEKEWCYSPADCYETKEDVGSELSDDDIRALAKDMNIKNWYNKGIDKLRTEIEECQQT